MTRAGSGLMTGGTDGLGRSPTGSNFGPRRLLARLRDVMAGSGSSQERLDKIVKSIAAEMVAEVCSCYLMRAGDILELFATVGLNAEAVHRTRLRVGEGLVGDIAARSRPLALANAQAHPNFAYRPETGEDPYQSLCGVPIMRGGRIRGVLVIQNRERRNYSEEEVETLQTIAMVVAEVVASGDLVNPQEIASVGDVGLMPSRLSGVGLNRGFAIGLAVLHRPRLTIREMVAEDPNNELVRLRTAVDSMHGAIDDLLEATRSAGVGEDREILETYRMFAEDRGWLTRIREAIGQGLTAEAAAQRVQNEMRARMSQMTDPYIRDRLLDLDDLTNRLLQHLAGKKSEAELGTLPDDVILVARSLGPAELLDYDRRRLRGLVLEEGSATSHVAIVARALQIPVIGRCTDALNRIEPLDPLIVDGDNGQVLVRPAEDVIEAVTRTMQFRVGRQRLYRELRDVPAETLDGESVSIQINASLLIELGQLQDTAADGIGLYRTEVPFMVHSAYPDVEAQTELYARVYQYAKGKPITFRTLDVGGDKTLPYFPEFREENPALGWRAIRIGLDRPAMLRKQLRALIRAAGGQRLRLKFPLVAEVAEFDAARRLLDLELERAATAGIKLPDPLEVGVMLEVPALLWQLDALLRSVDFVSVGSNDLIQYLYAADRGNVRVGSRYDSLSPPFLAMLAFLVEKCRAAQVPLSLCGEMAGQPLDAMALIGIGFRRLSMSPPSVGPVKEMIRSIDAGELAAYLSPHLRSREHSVREKLKAYARDHHVSLEDIAASG